MGSYWELHVFEVATGGRLWRYPPPRILVGSESGTDYTRPVFTPDSQTLLAGCGDRVHIWEAGTGKQRDSLPSHGADIRSLALSPDGRRLVTGGDDALGIIWDVTAFVQPQPVAERQLTEQELQTCWKTLAERDAAAAYSKLRLLRAAPAQAIALVKAHLRPVSPLDQAVVAKQLAALAGPGFKVREQAATALLQIGDQLLPSLEQELKKPLPLEARRRIEDLRAKVDPDAMNDGMLRGHRAIAVLETIATPAARELLQALANGTPPARLTQLAAAALKRLQ